MQQNNWTIQQSLDESGKMYEKSYEIFIESKKKLFESFDNPEIRRFVECLETMIIGLLEWSATTEKYNEIGENQKENRKIKLAL